MVSIYVYSVAVIVGLLGTVIADMENGIYDGDAKGLTIEKSLLITSKLDNLFYPALPDLEITKNVKEQSLAYNLKEPAVRGYNTITFDCESESTKESIDKNAYNFYIPAEFRAHNKIQEVTELEYELLSTRHDLLFNNRVPEVTKFSFQLVIVQVNFKDDLSPDYFAQAYKNDRRVAVTVLDGGLKFGEKNGAFSSVIDAFTN